MNDITVEDVFNNGVIGAGGAGFPAHIKLRATPDVIIMNAAECEPLIHKDIEILRCHSETVIKGFSAVMNITGCTRGIIGIKRKHSDVIASLKQVIPNSVEIIGLDDFYPAGDEITLIYSVTGRLVQPGQLPPDAGCLVFNVETLFNIGNNGPVTDSMLTVAGAVSSPGTVHMPVGTPYRDILAHFELMTRRYSIIANGLMMGRIQDDDCVVDKTTAGLIVLPEDHPALEMFKRYKNPASTVRLARAGCDQCNFCTELCPRYLLGYPVRPEIAMRNRMFSSGASTPVHDGNSLCCECNLCTMFACPEGLDPRGATMIEKRALQGMKWEVAECRPHPMMKYRKTPTRKLKQRLGIAGYTDTGPMRNVAVQPVRVKISLKQHRGNPALPAVREGDSVNTGDLIAGADGDISANVHASIAGRIIRIDEHEITIGAA